MSNKRLAIKLNRIKYYKCNKIKQNLQIFKD